MSKKARASSFVAAMCLMTVGLVAQGQEPQPQGTTGAAAAAVADPESAAPASAVKKVTLSGCVERQADVAPAAVVGAANTPFTLTKAAPTASTPAGSRVSLAVKAYRLDAAESMR